MSDKKYESWGSSFDHAVLGAHKGARRPQADREAKFENKYGRGRPNEQQPPHQGGAGALGTGDDEKTDGEVRRRWNWLRATLLRRGRNTTILWNFYATSHRNSRTSSSSSTNSSRI